MIYVPFIRPLHMLKGKNSQNLKEYSVFTVQSVYLSTTLLLHRLTKDPTFPQLLRPRACVKNEHFPILKLFLFTKQFLFLFYIVKHCISVINLPDLEKKGTFLKLCLVHAMRTSIHYYDIFTVYTRTIQTNRHTYIQGKKRRKQ